MRVAIVAPLVAPIGEPQLGGSQAFIADLARGLGERGHEVHLYAASGSRVAGVEVIDTGVDHHVLAGTLYRAGAPAPASDVAGERAFGAVYATIAEGRYDVVHNHAFDVPAVALAETAAAAVVHTLHLPPAPGLATALQRARRGRASPAVVCVSESQAGAWRSHVPVDAVLAPYVPTRAIPFEASAAPGALFAGRLSPEKGAAEAIDIARAAQIPIELFGDVYDERYAREQIEPRRSLPGVKVHAGVPRPALWEAMARASVVLCPARWEEPFGMAAAEAQACGTPVVAFARGGLREIVRDGVTGFLTAPDDIDAAADAVHRSGSLSRAECRRHAERELDLELTVTGHERIYELLAAAVEGARVGG